MATWAPTQGEEELLVVRMTDQAHLPTRATPQSAGLDLYNAYHFDLPPGARFPVKTGLRVQIPRGHYGRIAERSGYGQRCGLAIRGGVIDTDFRGELIVVMHNLGSVEYAFPAGTKIAQLICERVSYPVVREVQVLDETERGEGGFGSTGD